MERFGYIYTKNTNKEEIFQLQNNGACMNHLKPTNIVAQTVPFSLLEKTLLLPPRNIIHFSFCKNWMHMEQKVVSGGFQPRFLSAL